jgi:hypothetical protein
MHKKEPHPIFSNVALKALGFTVDYFVVGTASIFAVD